jgi:N-acyl-D-amino-acid deacylase
MIQYRRFVPRTAVCACAVLLTAVSPLTSADADERPMTGHATAGYESLDQAVLQFMDLTGAQAATLALSKDGQLVCTRGYGWRDRARRQPTRPNDYLRIASVTKPITAAAVKTLVRDGSLTLDTKVFEFLKLVPPRGSTPDPRLDRITVRHLLEHTAGWDATQSFDPMFRTADVVSFLKLGRPAEADDIVRYMLAKPLQFEPGERSQYSNFGYCVLGRVIEKAAGTSYSAYLDRALLTPHDIQDIRLARNLPRYRSPREVSYPTDDVLVEVMDSHGGLVASTAALCTFLDHYWIDGEPRESGLGRDLSFFGSLPGTTAMVRQRPDGCNVAVLFNGRRNDSIQEDLQHLKDLFEDAVQRIASAASE